MGRILFAPFRSFVTIREAEALDATRDASQTADSTEDEFKGATDKNVLPLWRTLLLACVALLQTLVWVAVGSYTLLTDKMHLWSGISSLLVACTWLYAACRPVFLPKPTIPFDLFVLYAIHLATGVLLLGGVLYEHSIFGVSLPPHLTVAGLVFNVVAVLVALITVLKMPFNIPAKHIKVADIVSIFLS